jgi:catechol 2,3-dioxygenase-like lactoylglutathione lyase family enzyme
MSDATSNEIAPSRRGLINGVAAMTGLSALLLGRQAAAQPAAPSPNRGAMMRGINGIHHISITVSDVQKALDFYSGILGFEKVVEAQWDERKPTSGEALPPDMIAQFKLIHRIEASVKTAAAAAIVRVNNAYIEFWEFRNPPTIPQDPNRPTRAGGYMHLALDVSDLEELYPRLQAAGVQFLAPPQRSPLAITTYGRDPFGNIIEFQEIPAGSTVPRAPL